MNPYRSAEWQAFRREVIALDDGACNRCGKPGGGGTVLQVHHKQYLAGRLPWQYPFNLCEALCKGCHAMEHGRIPPSFGWQFIGCDDLGDLSGACDYCNTEIRHVFLVQHQAWGAMEVGTDCCDRLTSTDVASTFMAEVKRRNTRRKTFVSSPRWDTDKPPFHTIHQRTPAGRKVSISVAPAPGGFKLWIKGKLGKRLFPTVAVAKGAAFDACESGDLDAWLQRIRKAKR